MLTYSEAYLQEVTETQGKPVEGFAADWIGQFYAYFQWHYQILSSKAVELVPPDFLISAYPGLHDLDLDMAVKKVGGQIGL